MQINPYLHFPGNCEAAFKFYETVLDAKITFMMTNADSPMPVPEGWGEKIMHATLSFEGGILMGADSQPAHYQTPAGFCVSISLKDLAKAEAIFAAFAEGGTVIMPFQKTFWAVGFGMVTDKFGTPWMVNVE